MSNDLKPADAVPPESLTEYELIMQLSDELAQKTDEVAALEAERADLQERLDKVTRELVEVHEEKEILVKVLAFESAAGGAECVPEPEAAPALEPEAEFETESAPEQIESFTACGRMSKIVFIVAAIVALVAIAAVASVVTFSMLYDMELAAAASVLTERAASLLR